MTKRSKKTPARKLYRVVFSGANGKEFLSSDVPGTFKTRADGLKALRAVKTQQKIENLGYSVQKFCVHPPGVSWRTPAALLESFRAETLTRVAELEKALRDLLASCSEECHCATCMNAAHVLNASDPNWLARQIAEAKKPLVEALQGILDIGKRDMSNPKYDGYFETARAALESTKSKLAGDKALTEKS